MTSLTDKERETLSPEDRALLDAAIQAIPSERNAEFTAFMLSIRAIIKHDTAGVHNVVAGVFELQDQADDARRELLEAAREMRAATEELRTTVTTAMAQIASLGSDVRTLAMQNDAEHQELWAVLSHVQEAHWTTRYAGTIIAVMLALAVLATLWRAGL